jgi:hypothetical protein
MPGHNVQNLHAGRLVDQSHLCAQCRNAEW